VEVPQGATHYEKGTSSMPIRRWWKVTKAARYYWVSSAEKWSRTKLFDQVNLNPITEVQENE